jgi:hypothetical protein
VAPHTTPQEDRSAFLRVAQSGAGGYQYGDLNRKKDEAWHK